jgi:uncharacterized protein YegL
MSLSQQALTTSHYGYSAARIEDLGATEYTLVTIVTDSSGSVAPYKNELEKTLKQIAQACRRSPRADNLMLRLVEFDDKLRELHGFKLLENCHAADYDGMLSLGGSTALYDATENAVSATTDYAKRLGACDFGANAIVFVLTDGMDNVSKLGAKAVKAALTQAVREEALESVVSVLIGIDVKGTDTAKFLQHFFQEAGFTQYVEIGKADAKTLAKLAEFVSRSISAQSQSLGTGGPSQSLTF